MVGPPLNSVFGPQGGMPSVASGAAAEVPRHVTSLKQGQYLLERLPTGTRRRVFESQSCVTEGRVWSP